jgi:hypothetical protein
MIPLSVMIIGENRTSDTWGHQGSVILVNGDRTEGGAQGRVTPPPNSIYRPQSVLI